MPADLDALLTHVYVLVFSCRADGSAVVPFGSPTASSSASRSPKCCSTVPTSGASCVSPSAGCSTCSRTSPASPASTSACAPSPRSSWRRSRSLLGFHPPSAIACACSTRRRCRARPRARPYAARGSPGSPATATVARIIATSGASGFISCARRTGCRSASSSLPPTPPSAWSRPSSRARARTGTDARLRQRLCRAGVRAARGLVESAHPASRPAQTSRRASARSAASASGSSGPSTRSRTNSRSSATGVGRSLASSAASPVGCWRSPPRSCTTGRSASPDGASSPTTTKESIV